ncbi:hypothetical protein O5282_27040 [Escherichia coli]|nr:hypothetical protein [Escherichia coli]
MLPYSRLERISDGKCVSDSHDDGQSVIIHTGFDGNWSRFFFPGLHPGKLSRRQN